MNQAEHYQLLCGILPRPRPRSAILDLGKVQQETEGSDCMYTDHSGHYYTLDVRVLMW